MVCRYCRPDIFPDCDAPLREGHIAARWGPSDLTKEDLDHIHVYVNGEEVFYWNEVCPGACGFVVCFARTTVFDPYNPDYPHRKGAYRRCECANFLRASTAEYMLFGSVTMQIRGTPSRRRKEIANVRA